MCALNSLDLVPVVADTVDSAPTSRISKGNEIAHRVSNFNVTVLRVYWELGARTGTKIKLVVSTFTFWKHFLFSKQISLPNLDKAIWLWIRFRINFTRYFRCDMGTHGRNPQNETSEFEISASSPFPFRVLSTEATQFNSQFDRRPPHCARAIPPIPLSETLCWGAYRGCNLV